MFSIPKLEPITRDATIAHFFLMFGYKLFSIYFPLYLVSINFSLGQVGYTAFLIYLPIALFSPVAGFLNHKIRPAILASLGILGYGIYALGMLLSPAHIIFYFLQVVLGISASLFFVSARNLLMSARLENPNRAFGWFYSAVSYADAFAPAIGALIIWRFGYTGAFALSFVIQAANAIFCFTKLRKEVPDSTEKIKISKSIQKYSKVLDVIKGKGSRFYIFSSFLILILAGFNSTFFLLFLKNLGWAQNKILIFNSVLSLIFLPISIFLIKQIAKAQSELNISKGSQILGIFTLLLGGLSSILNFYHIFIISLGQSIGGLMSGSGRSGLMATKLKEHPEESAAVDTTFSPLATAVGSVIGGLLIGPLGYSILFILSGTLLLGTGILGVVKSKRLS